MHMSLNRLEYFYGKEHWRISHKPYGYSFVYASFLFYWCISMCLLKISLRKSLQGTSFEHKCLIRGERGIIFVMKMSSFPLN